MQVMNNPIKLRKKEMSNQSRLLLKLLMSLFVTPSLKLKLYHLHRA